MSCWNARKSTIAAQKIFPTARRWLRRGSAITPENPRPGAAFEHLWHHVRRRAQLYEYPAAWLHFIKNLRTRNASRGRRLRRREYASVRLWPGMLLQHFGKHWCSIEHRYGNGRVPNLGSRSRLASGDDSEREINTLIPGTKWRGDRPQDFSNKGHFDDFMAI